MTDASSLEVPSREPCAFCEYLAGRRPYTVLWRETKVAVLVTREQRGIAHLLALPVEHRETILDLEQTEAAPLMIAIRDAANAIDEAYERPGIAIWQNNGLPAHQQIPHLHFHVAGTLPEGGTDFGDVRELAVSETDAIAGRLRSFVPEFNGAERRLFT